MKKVVFMAALVLASTSWAVAEQDLVAQILDENNCTPVSRDGRVSALQCEGSLGEIAETAAVAKTFSDVNDVLSLDDEMTQKLKMEIALSLNGKVVSRPQIITELNQSVQITEKEKKSNKEYVIEVLPSVQKMKNQDFVQMQFKVIEKSNGKDKVLSTASLLGKANQQAEILVQSDDPKDRNKTVSIKVTPTWVESQTTF